MSNRASIIWTRWASLASAKAPVGSWLSKRNCYVNLCKSHEKPVIMLSDLRYLMEMYISHQLQRKNNNKPEKGWNESQRLFCDSRMSGTEPTNDPMVRNGNIALLAKWAVEPKTRL